LPLLVLGRAGVRLVPRLLVAFIEVRGTGLAWTYFSQRRVEFAFIHLHTTPTNSNMPDNLALGRYVPFDFERGDPMAVSPRRIMADPLVMPALTFGDPI
jgi:hypothetical protein